MRSCHGGANLKFTLLSIILLEAALREALAQRPFLAHERAAAPDVIPPGAPGATLSTGLMQQFRFSAASTMTAYLFMVCMTAGAVVALYWSKGWLVICRIIVYLLALSTMKLSVKMLFVDYNFNFPKFVTTTHFVTGGLVAFSILYWREKSNTAGASTALLPGTKVLAKSLHQRLGVPTRHEFGYMIVPISLGFAISVAANNAALLFSSAAFTEILGSATPVASIGLMLVLGMPFDMRLLGPTLLVVAGCASSVSGELHFSGLGMALCLISILGRAVKTTLQQYMMTGDSKAKFDPVTLLAWMCVPSSLLMTLWFLRTEGVAPITMLLESQQQKSLWSALGISCINACVLNLSSLFCVRDLGAVGSQLVAQTKSVLTVLGAVALFHEAVTPVELLGFVAVLVGVYLFSHMERSSKNQP